MNVIEIISELRENNVLPVLEAGGLKLVGDTDRLTSDFLSTLRENKAQLIEFLEERELSASSDIVPIKKQPFYRATHGQERIWVLSQFDGGNVAYNMPGSFYIKGVIDLKRFEQAFQSVIQVHESLRTYFEVVNDELVQKVKDNVAFAIEKETIVDQANKIDRLKEMETKFRWEAFDLEKAPLLRVKIIQISDDEFGMFFSIHHIIGDGWSMGVLIQEVMASYESLCKTGTPSVQNKRIQFKDYASWLSTKIEGSFGDKARKFWKEKNLASIEPINLPIDFARPDVNSFEGASQKFYFGNHLNDGIEALAKKNQTTVFNIYRAVLSLAFHKWTNQSAIALGTPIAGRSNYLLNDQIGLYINTLILVSHYPEDATFSEYLADIYHDSLDVFKYQEFPLDLIIDDNEIKRNAGRNPVFDILMVVQNNAVSDGTIDTRNHHGFTLDGIGKFYQEEDKEEFSDITTKVDMTFTFALDSEKGQFLEIEHKTKLFKRSTVQSFYKIIEYIFAQVIANDAIRIQDINIVDPEEEKIILNQFNKPISTHPETNILEMLKPSFNVNGSLLAVKDDDSELTYNQLEHQSNVLAAELSNVTSEGIGFFLSRSTKLISCVLATWKADKFYVPIDIKYPPGRIDYIIENAGVELLLVDSKSMEMLPDSYLGKVLNIDELDYNSTVAQPTYSNSKQDVGYLIYTSGSTGRPKGVQITHENVIAFLKWSEEEFGNTPYSTMFAGTSYCFDLSIFEMLLPLMQGKTIRVLESGISIPDFLMEDKNIFINTVPSVIRSLLDQEVSWKNVVAINMAGEPVPKIFKDKLDYQKIEVRNLYGPSEDTTYSTFYRFEKDGLPFIPIGVPVGDTHAYILDKNLKMVPIGVEGEICLSGRSIAKGYLGMDELTKEKFVDNPFLEGERMYRTGDIGRWTNNGLLSFTGRMDDQVKVRGFRIELGEIQYQLDVIKEIEQALVVVATVNNEKEIIAYFKCNSDLEEAKIREILAENLPQYMIPGYFVQMDEFPLNSNGKIDKAQLPAPSASRRKEVIAPKTETQEKILKLWEEVLGTTGFGIESNFFELGGHSLKATKFKNLVLSNLHKEITLNEIFLNPLIPAQATLLDTKPLKRKEKIIASITETEELIPLSFAQERLWVLTQFEDVSRAYHMPVGFIVDNEIDIPLFEKAIGYTIERHESLRTVFKEQGGIAYQHVLRVDEINFKISVFDLGENGDSEAHLLKSWNENFDLENGPLLRCEYLILGSKRILSFNMHHIISDGWSIEVLYNDVIKSYLNLLKGESGALEPLRIQYRDFSAWQKEQFSPDRLEEQLSYWKNEVFKSGITALELPYDFDRPIIKTYVGDTYSREFSKDLSDKILTQASEHGLSIFMSIFANVGILLKKLSNQDDITIGTPVAGRDSDQLQQQIGFFVNTLPIRCDLKGSQTIKELFLTIRENMLSAFDYQHFPFEMLVEELEPKRDISRSPLFDVMVAYQNFGIIDNKNPELNDVLNLERLELSSGIAKYDLAISFSSVNDKLQMEVNYSTGLFKHESIIRIIDQLELVFQQTVKNIDQKIEDISIIPKMELDMLMSTGDMTGVDYDRNETIVSRFKSCVQAHPDSIALVVEDMKMTYGDLDKKSGQLARVLVEQYQVKDEELIVLHIDRSEWTIIAILACLKAGAAYVPVDTDAPDSRKQFVIENSETRLILHYGQIPLNSEIVDQQEVINITEIELSGDLFEKEIRADQLAYVIYTSGAIGNPRGVMVEHRNVNRLLFNQADYFNFNTSDRWSLFHSTGVDLSVWEMFGALLKGGTLVVAPKEVVQDSVAFFDFLVEQEITILNLTPSAFRSLISMNEDRFSEIKHSIRNVIFGGETLIPATLKAWHLNYPECKLINMYGNSETTVHAAYKEITSNEIELNKTNIGAPIPTLSCYVLDVDLKPCAPGVIGELCVGGAGVARGYLNNTDLTNEKFIDNPFVKGEKMFLSGDYARMLPTGDIEYIGRRDEQVKIRGHRVELAEVESELKALREVKDAVVITFKNNADEFELIAYYILHSSENQEVSIRDILGDSLPIYKIPSLFVKMEEFPLTRNGKLDKEALPFPSEEELSRRSYVAPDNEIQQTVVEIWEQVLERTNIGIRDNFFELGGHSVKATRVISKIQESFGVKINLGSLFIDPTIESLAKQISTLTWMAEQNNQHEMEGEGEELII